MRCKKCREENTQDAVFCRKCGERLSDEVKKAEIIDYTSNNNQQSTYSPKPEQNDFKNCCLCVVAIFIIFGILGTLFIL